MFALVPFFRTRTRYHRAANAWWVALRWGFVVIVLAIAGSWSYSVGTGIADRRALLAGEELDDLVAENARLIEQVSGVRAELQISARQVARLSTLLEEASPAGKAGELKALLGRKQAEGVSIDRLIAVVASLAAERVCDAGPEHRELVVRTPRTRGPKNFATLADNTLTVTAADPAELRPEPVSATPGEGEPVSGASGTAAGQRVAVMLSHFSGRQTEVVGVPPLTRSLIVGNDEFVMTVSPAGEDRVDVSVLRCDFP